MTRKFGVFSKNIKKLPFCINRYLIAAMANPNRPEGHIFAKLLILGPKYGLLLRI
jgi:hypothetical protein